MHKTMHQVNILSQFGQNAGKVNPKMKSAEEKANIMCALKSTEEKMERRETVSLN